MQFSALMFVCISRHMGKKEENKMMPENDMGLGTSADADP